MVILLLSSPSTPSTPFYPYLSPLPPSAPSNLFFYSFCTFYPFVVSIYLSNPFQPFLPLRLLLPPLLNPLKTSPSIPPKTISQFFNSKREISHPNGIIIRVFIFLLLMIISLVWGRFWMLFSSLTFPPSPPPYPSLQKRFFMTENPFSSGLDVHSKNSLLLARCLATFLSHTCVQSPLDLKGNEKFSKIIFHSFLSAKLARPPSL